MANFDEIKKKVETLKSSSERAQGALEQTMRKIKEEFEVETLEEAEKLLEKMHSEVDTMKVDFEKKLKEFEEEWEGVI